MRRLLATALTTTWLVMSTACHNNRLPCPDCDADDQAADDSDPVPDLPCGGADLLTDDYNCGSCGNECPVALRGEEWEAGGCVQGECGPTWSDCSPSGFGETCNEVCEPWGACVPQGCSGGYTAMLINVGLDACNPLGGPDGTMTGPCDEPIPWEVNEDGEATHALCCCKYE